MRSPEQDLWCAVLMCQIDDALYGPLGVTGTDRRLRAIDDARRLLTTRNKSLSLICSLAGLELEAVIEALTKRIAGASTAQELAATQILKSHLRPKKTAKKKAPQIKNADRLFTLNGETLTMADWAERNGLSVPTIVARLNQGWADERALTQPIGKRIRGWGATGNARPGGGSDLGSDLQTGAHRSVEDGTNISSSEKRVEA